MPLNFWQRSLESALGGLGDFTIQLVFQSRDLFGGQDALAQQAHLHLGDGIAQGVGFALGLRAIEPVVVGERVGVAAYAVAVDKGRPQARAAVGHGALKGLITCLRIGAVHLCKVEVGEVGHQARDIAAGRAHLDRSADGVAVVFDTKNDRQLPVRGGIERLPELALRGGTFAQQGEDDFVAVKLHIVEGAVVTAGFFGGFGVAAEVAAGLGAADGMEHLRGGGRGRTDNVERAAAPVGGHLAASAGRIGGRAHGLQEHFIGSDAQGQAERAIAIVGEEPIVTGAHGQGSAHLQRLVAGGGDLEEDLLLALEQDFAVVHAAGENHQPVDLDHLPRAQAAGADGRHGLTSAGSCQFHSLDS